MNYEQLKTHHIKLNIDYTSLSLTKTQHFTLLNDEVFFRTSSYFFLKVNKLNNQLPTDPLLNRPTWRHEDSLIDFHVLKLSRFSRDLI